VGEPVPSGHRVVTSSTLQRVGMFGQDVSTYGQAVWTPKQKVGLSGQKVIDALRYP